MEDWKERALKAEKRLEDYEYLALACAEAWKAWPLVKWNQIRNFCAHMDNIKEALSKVL